MKKRSIAALALLVCLLLSLGTVPAGAVSESTALETVRALGILAGDENGNLNLTSSVTRAEFVTMMTAASAYKDTVGTGTGVSLFKDVKSSHWASQYIRLAVEQEWMIGFVDGTFRPDNPISLEEGCTALLKLLGYQSSDLVGSYPSAQLTKAASVGLLDDLDVAQGQTLTRQDCVMLFYNLMLAETSTGAVYATTLGYTVTNGELDYSALVSADTKGPYVAESGTLTLPFSADGATIYRNGGAASLSEVQPYDVYYYNANLNTVWVYSDRVSGTLTAVSPSSAAPTSVTVAGGTYQLGTATAVYKCSSQGSFAPGDLVTLLLGMNGEVVDVLDANETETTYYGLVLSSEKTGSTSATSSSASLQVETQVACTDGTARTFYTSGTTTYSTGRLVSVTLGGTGTSIQSLSSKHLSGTVSQDGTSFAGYDFAADVQILDTDDSGGYARIYPSRLAGERLSESDVAYYTLDENGDIDRLILDEVTGDTLDYVYITDEETSSADFSISGTYTYYQNGESRTFTGNKIYSVSVGGAVLRQEDGEVTSLRQLTSVRLTGLGDLSATADNQTYRLAEDVQVILRGTGSDGYYATTLSEVDAENYTLQGWYDNLGCSAGGRIRIIVATPKS